MERQGAKPGLAGIGGVLRNDRGVILCMFSKGVGIRDSNEADVLAILETLRISLGHSMGLCWLKVIHIMQYSGFLMMLTNLRSFTTILMRLSFGFPSFG